MIAIIGEDDSKKKTISCAHCGALLQYLPIDVKTYNGTDYSGGPDGKDYINCPRCSKEVIINAW